MAGSMLSIGLTGLAAFQRSLNTIGHNISNVNTPGFSRQRTILTNNDPTPFGNGFVGNGSRIVTTERIYNEHAVNQVRSRTSSTEYFSVYNEFATQIDNLLADQDAGLAPALEGFFDSIQGVADDPTSIPAREVMMTQSQALVDRMQTMEDWLSDLRRASNDRMLNQVVSINALSSQIADMNQEIIVATGIGQGQPPNDLLDQRDTLIDELSSHIGITVLTQDDGSQNVFMSNGQSLVLGTQARELVAQPDPDDPLYYEIAYKNDNLPKLVAITDSLKGGDLGGVVNFRNDILKPAQNYMGWIAQGLARTFNDQHEKGIDLNDALGGDYFTESAMHPNSMMKPSVYNTGAAVLTLNDGSTTPAFADRYDVADIKPTSYKLVYDGANYTLENLSDGTVTALTVSVPGPPVEFDPVDGMYLELDVIPNANDKFFIHATRDAARKFNLEFSDPNLISASQPLRTWIDSGNGGRGANSGGAKFDLTITDETVLGSGATVPFPLPILFDDQVGPTGGTATHYSTDGGASWNAYNPSGTTLGNAVTDGFTVTLSGNAIDGDHFYIDASGGKNGNQGEVKIDEANITDITLFKAAFPEEPSHIIFRDSGGAVQGVADEYSPDGGLNWFGYSATGTTITSANGWEVTLSGEAWVGDAAYVAPNTAGSGDNRNARELAELQLKGIMIGGNATFHEAYSEIVTSVGNNTQQAEINHRAQEALLNQSVELRESISGVNLDEEAANLLRFQQAYTAAAQVIAAADNVFQTLISAVGR